MNIQIKMTELTNKKMERCLRSLVALCLSFLFVISQCVFPGMALAGGVDQTGGTQTGTETWTATTPANGDGTPASNPLASTPSIVQTPATQTTVQFSAGVGPSGPLQPINGEQSVQPFEVNAATRNEAGFNYTYDLHVTVNQDRSASVEWGWRGAREGVFDMTTNQIITTRVSGQLMQRWVLQFEKEGDTYHLLSAREENTWQNGETSERTYDFDRAGRCVHYQFHDQAPSYPYENTEDTWYAYNEGGDRVKEVSKYIRTGTFPYTSMSYKEKNGSVIDYVREMQVSPDVLEPIDSVDDEEIILNQAHFKVTTFNDMLNDQGQPYTVLYAKSESGVWVAKKYGTPQGADEFFMSFLMWRRGTYVIRGQADFLPGVEENDDILVENYPKMVTLPDRPDLSYRVTAPFNALYDPQRNSSGVNFVFQRGSGIIAPIDYPNGTTVTLDGQEYEVTIDRQGNITLERVPEVVAQYQVEVAGGMGVTLMDDGSYEVTYGGATYTSDANGIIRVTAGFEEDGAIEYRFNFSADHTLEKIERYFVGAGDKLIYFLESTGATDPYKITRIECYKVDAGSGAETLARTVALDYVKNTVTVTEEGADAKRVIIEDSAIEVLFGALNASSMDAMKSLLRRMPFADAIVDAATDEIRSFTAGNRFGVIRVGAWDLSLADLTGISMEDRAAAVASIDNTLEYFRGIMGNDILIMRSLSYSTANDGARFKIIYSSTDGSLTAAEEPPARTFPCMVSEDGTITFDVPQTDGRTFRYRVRVDDQGNVTLERMPVVATQYQVEVAGGMGVTLMDDGSYEVTYGDQTYPSDRDGFVTIPVPQYDGPSLDARIRFQFNENQMLTAIERVYPEGEGSVRLSLERVSESANEMRIVRIEGVRVMKDSSGNPIDTYSHVMDIDYAHAKTILTRTGGQDSPETTTVYYAQLIEGVLHFADMLDPLSFLVRNASGLRGAEKVISFRSQGDVMQQIFLDVEGGSLEGILDVGEFDLTPAQMDSMPVADRTIANVRGLLVDDKRIAGLASLEGQSVSSSSPLRLTFDINIVSVGIELNPGPDSGTLVFQALDATGTVYRAVRENGQMVLEVPGAGKYDVLIDDAGIVTLRPSLIATYQVEVAGGMSVQLLGDGSYKVTYGGQTYTSDANGIIRVTAGFEEDGAIEYRFNFSADHTLEKIERYFAGTGDQYAYFFERTGDAYKITRVECYRIDAGSGAETLYQTVTIDYTKNTMTESGVGADTEGVMVGNSAIEFQFNAWDASYWDAVNDLTLREVFAAVTRNVATGDIVSVSIERQFGLIRVGAWDISLDDLTAIPLADRTLEYFRAGVGNDILVKTGLPILTANDGARFSIIYDDGSIAAVQRLVGVPPVTFPCTVIEDGTITFDVPQTDGRTFHYRVRVDDQGNVTLERLPPIVVIEHQIDVNGGMSVKLIEDGSFEMIFGDRTYRSQDGRITVPAGSYPAEDTDLTFEFTFEGNTISEMSIRYLREYYGIEFMPIKDVYTFESRDGMLRVTTMTSYKEYPEEWGVGDDHPTGWIRERVRNINYDTAIIQEMIFSDFNSNLGEIQMSSEIISSSRVFNGRFYDNGILVVPPQEVFTIAIVTGSIFNGENVTLCPPGDASKYSVISVDSNNLTAVNWADVPLENRNMEYITANLLGDDKLLNWEYVGNAISADDGTEVHLTPPSGGQILGDVYLDWDGNAENGNEERIQFSGAEEGGRFFIEIPLQNGKISKYEILLDDEGRVTMEKREDVGEYQAVDVLDGMVVAQMYNGNFGVIINGKIRMNQEGSITLPEEDYSYEFYNLMYLFYDNPYVMDLPMEDGQGRAYEVVVDGEGNLLIERVSMVIENINTDAVGVTSGAIAFDVTDLPPGYTVQFGYRKKGTTDNWRWVTPMVQGTKVSVNLDGLVKETEYEYQIQVVSPGTRVVSKQSGVFETAKFVVQVATQPVAGAGSANDFSVKVFKNGTALVIWNDVRLTGTFNLFLRRVTIPLQEAWKSMTVQLEMSGSQYYLHSVMGDSSAQKVQMTFARFGSSVRLTKSITWFYAPGTPLQERQSQISYDYNTVGQLTQIDAKNLARNASGAFILAGREETTYFSNSSVIRQRRVFYYNANGVDLGYRKWTRTTLSSDLVYNGFYKRLFLSQYSKVAGCQEDQPISECLR